MKTVILTPLGSQTHHNFTHSLQATERAFPGQIDWVDTAGVSDVAAGRNRLLDEFLRMTMAGACVWIDSDESWTPADLSAVLTPIVCGDAEVVAAPYAVKKQGVPWYNFALHLEDCDIEKGYIGPRKTIGGRDYVRVRYAGTGFLAMSRAAAMRAAAIVPRYQLPMTDRVIAGLFEPMIENCHRYGEDYGACRTMGQAGLEILLALKTKIIHYDGLQRFDTEALDLDVLARGQAAKK